MMLLKLSLSASTFPALNGKVPGVSTQSALTLDITLARPSLPSKRVSPSVEKLKRTLCVSMDPKDVEAPGGPPVGVSGLPLTMPLQHSCKERLGGSVCPGQLPAPLPKGHV